MSSIVAIRRDVAELSRHAVNPTQAINMTTASNGGSQLIGCLEHLPIKVGSITALVNARIVDDAPFQVLLGLPWIRMVLGRLVHEDNEWWGYVANPMNSKHEIRVYTHPHYSQNYALSANYFVHTSSHTPAAFASISEVSSNED
jgi:hypothetical protein